VSNRGFDKEHFFVKVEVGKRHKIDGSIGLYCELEESRNRAAIRRRENAMNRSCLFQCGQSAVVVMLLILLFAGCSSDNPTQTTPDPNLSMSLECSNGLTDCIVQNTGGPMSQPSRFVASFADGHVDTLLLSVESDSSHTCLLSNIHGDVTVTNEEFGLEKTSAECLTEYFAGFLASIDLDSLIPSPVSQQQVVACTYTIYLEHLTSSTPTAELIKTDSGLTLKSVYGNITAGLRATSPGALCPDLTGNVAISSVVVSTNIDIDNSGTHQVTLGATQTTINGLQVNVDGVFGFVIELMVGFFQNQFTGMLQNAVTTTINSQLGSDLSGLVIVDSECGG
jgi:hypothetical protein